MVMRLLGLLAQKYSHIHDILPMVYPILDFSHSIKDLFLYLLSFMRGISADVFQYQMQKKQTHCVPESQDLCMFRLHLHKNETTNVF